MAAIISVQDLDLFGHMEEEQADRWKALDRMREAFKDVPDDELERQIARAVEEAREELRERTAERA